MFFCEDCGLVFEEPKTIYEHHPYGMGTAAEEWHVCPHCKSPNIAEAKQCNCCGEYFAELEDGDLCDVCYGDLYGE